jgi:hypothetical protein
MLLSTQGYDSVGTQIAWLFKALCNFARTHLEKKKIDTYNNYKKKNKTKKYGLDCSINITEYIDRIWTNWSYL